MNGSCRKQLLALCAAALIGATLASAQQHGIDVQRSAMTVRVYKAGLLSALGHDHEIGAPISAGWVNASAREVELHVNASTLQVRDQNISDKDRAEIQSTMLGPEVLDAERYREIVFRSTGIEPTGTGSWRVNGALTLHAQTRPVVVEVHETSGSYVGSARFRQTDFGIRPVKVAGGTIRVKDEIRIEFHLELAQ